MKSDLSRLQKTVSIPKEGDNEILPASKASSTRKTSRKKNAVALDPLADVLEDAVKKEVQQLIDLYRLSIKRQNTGAMKIKKRYVKFGDTGDGDFAGWCQYTGRHVEIDYRTPLGSLEMNVGNLATGWFVWDRRWNKPYWNTSIIDVQKYCTLGAVKE